jgi:hypothetical protein
MKKVTDLSPKINVLDIYSREILGSSFSWALSARLIYCWYRTGVVPSKVVIIFLNIIFLIFNIQ